MTEPRAAGDVAPPFVTLDHFVDRTRRRLYKALVVKAERRLSRANESIDECRSLLTAAEMLAAAKALRGDD